MADADRALYDSCRDKWGRLDVTAFSDEVVRAWLMRFSTLLEAWSPELLEEHVGLASSAPSRFMDDMHCKSPCLAALLAYGLPGIDALVRLAAAGEASAVGAVRVLIATASGVEADAFADVLITARYTEAEAFVILAERIRQVVGSAEGQEYAARQLAKLCEAYVKDPHGWIDLGTMLTTGALRGDADTGRLLLEMIAWAHLSIGPTVCDEFESLLSGDLAEIDYQRFLEEHPTILDPLALDVVPKQCLGAEFQTDFAIRRVDNEFVLVELEKPSDSVFTQYPQPSQQLSHALAQVLNWFAWVEDNMAYARLHGLPDIRRPKALIVIGRRGTLSPQAARQLEALNGSLAPDIRVVTYDDVVSQARVIAANLLRKTAADTVGRRA